MKWTKEQQEVISVRDHNVLVSAAAGSGKTAVLVQRIIDRILDSEHPVDVDRMLVVTFTNAAAQEMKERIRKALDKALLEDPHNSRLRTQVSLVHTAHIRTTDSFCSYIVKNYFYEIDADPAFSIAGKGELNLLADEALEAVLSDRFLNPTEDFSLLSKAYLSDGKSIDTFKSMVYTLHREAMSNAWPDAWLDSCLRLYEADTVDKMCDSDFIQYIVKRANSFFAICAREVRDMLSNYTAEASKDKDVLLAEEAYFEAMAQENSYVRLYELACGLKFATYNNSKSKALDEEYRESLKARRDAYKKRVNDFIGKMFGQSPGDTLDSLGFVRRQATELVEIVRDYKNVFFDIKKKRKVFDFNDIEHMALEILREADTVDHEKRNVAKELSAFFEEVMVDEYQDSNDLQEAILTAVCKDNNYFTVGDVKQSIYAFRQARPALFNDKFNRYISGENQNTRIDLDCNFRSRSEVLDFCNRVFYPLMQDDMGNVTYDEAAALKVGALGYDKTGYDLSPEIIIGDPDKEDLITYGFNSADEMEAQIVANRIAKLVNEGFLVSDNTNDPAKKLQRKIRFSDIVLLFRSVSTRGPVYTRILKANGIPAYLEEETGFFDREEISDILSVLRIIDNPYNDIPMATVLHSPIFGFSSERLAQIRVARPKNSFCRCIFDYASEHDDEDVRAFVEFIDRYREMAKDTPIHELIQNILTETGYLDYVLALPMGENKTANLYKLIDEAISFEKTSYQGLSGFVNYIDSLKTYKEDPGVAKLTGENENAVRIMTIHKSKGLEFPVVFLCGTGHKFPSEKDAISFNDKFGVAMNYHNPVTRSKSDTVFMKVVRDYNRIENLGEEQRILYVALTRAKEKLIVTGCVGALDEEHSIGPVLEKYSSLYDRISFEDKFGSTSYIEWILRALFSQGGTYPVSYVRCSDLLLNKIENTTLSTLSKKYLSTMYEMADAKDGEALYNQIKLDYEVAAYSSYKTKYSVSEIKHQAMEEAFGFDSDAAPAFIVEDDSSYVPAFMREKSVSDEIPAGALYGSAMHRVMECIDFTEDNLSESLNNQLGFMKETSTLSADELGLISQNRLESFLHTSLADRMHLAALRGELYKEQPFVLSCPVRELFADAESEDETNTVLVQGIIDVFFKEDDGIVLMDYKTDRVDEVGELVLRYEKQLALYGKALSRAYKLPVKEILIYSFYFNEVIPCTIS